MEKLSLKALSLAIIALVHERQRAVDAHNNMKPSDESFEEIGDISEQINSVLWEFREIYEKNRQQNPIYQSYDELIQVTKKY